MGLGRLTQLVDFTIARDFPHITGTVGERRVAWFAEVCETTAVMIVHWMRVGFVHGVMNTDNMSILGLTVDYGPYGWLDNFDPTWTPNTTDASGRRYRFGQQPLIAQWNLMRLADALRPLFDSAAPLQDALTRYHAVYTAQYDAMTAAKFGFRAYGDVEQTLIREAFALLYDANVDYTLFFRALGEIPDTLPEFSQTLLLLGDVFYDESALLAHGDALAAWMVRWHAHTVHGEDGFAARRARMHAVNPRYVLRNYLAQQAIDLATMGDASMVQTLLEVMRRPYEDQPQYAQFATKRPEWAMNKAGCSMLSCSS